LVVPSAERKTLRERAEAAIEALQRVPRSASEREPSKAEKR
jgi:hypothetical protein